MKLMKWMVTLFAAATLCAGSAWAADPAAVGGSVGKDEQTDHAAHAGHAATTPAAGTEEPAGATHDMKCCMEMGGKKCMEMGDKKCMEMDGKKCMEMGDKKSMGMDGKHCDAHKDKKCLHKSHAACKTMKGAAQSDENKPAEKKSDSKDETAKPAAKAAEPVLSAAEGRALAQKSNCLACHSIEKKVVGPALKDVAAKYRGDASAEEKLIAKVSKGSSGVWGNVPMPANSPAVKDADIKALVKFVLSLK